MRRYGILIYFICTPLAQILLLRQHYNILPSLQEGVIKLRLLQYQLVAIVLMLVIGIISGALDVTHIKTYESENIVEWNLALLMQLYFLGMIFVWKDYRYYLRGGGGYLAPPVFYFQLYPLVTSFLVTGDVFTACSKSLLKTSPLFLDNLRLNRKVYSSKYDCKCSCENDP